MTSYNYAQHIGAAIESVLGQTLPSWELLIVDDSSSDNSWEVISRYTDPRIHATRFDRSRGACAAYNAAYAIATGEYIASLDSDDMFRADKLQRQAEFLDANREIGICGTYVDEIDASGLAVPLHERQYAPWFNIVVNLNDPANWIWQNHLCHSSTAVRKEVHDRIGGFNEQLAYTPDWEFWVRALVGWARFHVIPEPLVSYRAHGGNITHKDPARRRREYATFSSTILHPYLEQIGRIDLIVENTERFLQDSLISEDRVLNTASLLELLCKAPFRQDGSARPSGDSGDDIMEALAIKLAGEVAELKTWLADQEAAVRWQDEQRQNWQRIAQERVEEVAELKTWLADREAAVRWQDEQRQNWQRIAQERVEEMAERQPPPTTASSGVILSSNGRVRSAIAALTRSMISSKQSILARGLPTRKR
jgi:glycosyltransferase involved in cell wall biosynthesis